MNHISVSGPGRSQSWSRFTSSSESWSEDNCWLHSETWSDNWWAESHSWFTSIAWSSSWWISWPWSESQLGGL